MFRLFSSSPAVKILPESLCKRLCVWHTKNMTNTDTATVLETPELVDTLNMAAYALELAIAEGIIDADSSQELKLALAEQAFLTIALDRIMYHPDHNVSEAIVQGIGKLVYREAA